MKTLKFIIDNQLGRPDALRNVHICYVVRQLLDCNQKISKTFETSSILVESLLRLDV
jgi:hypothetical protein